MTCAACNGPLPPVEFSHGGNRFCGLYCASDPKFDTVPLARWAPSARLSPMSKTLRFVDWGHWGISFWNGDRSDIAGARAIAKITFPVGPQGPIDGHLGSRERVGYADMCRAWVDRGELPEGAFCWISEAWLYDESYPGAKWKPGRGWTGPERRGRAWVYDFVPGEFGT